MSELPREFIARYTAGGAVGIASVCSAHPAVIKTTALALARAKVHWALPAYSFEGADD